MDLQFAEFFLMVMPKVCWQFDIREIWQKPRVFVHIIIQKE
jgi:hypothetical protein